MSALQFPCTIFKTQNLMDDYGAADMLYGDLTETQLKNDFHLLDVSARVNPYTLTKITPFSQPHSMFHGSRGAGEKVTHQECANILFDELRHLSQSFALYGPYKYLIVKMINHMQDNTGTPFTSLDLNRALKEHIVNDRDSENSTRILLQEALSTNIDWSKNIYPADKKINLLTAILQGKLPKFDRIQDNINGLGITIHDTWATHIIIDSLNINKERYHATIRYKVQDHFGLDTVDISKTKFGLFRFFRIWFVLQHYENFSYRPFINDMDVTVEIEGKNNEDS
jgi:uncharacterized protein (TIGR03034 family)